MKSKYYMGLGLSVPRKALPVFLQPLNRLSGSTARTMVAPTLCLAAEGAQRPLAKPLLARGSWLQRPGHQAAGRQLQRSHLISKDQVRGSEMAV